MPGGGGDCGMGFGGERLEMVGVGGRDGGGRDGGGNGDGWGFWGSELGTIGGDARFGSNTWRHGCRCILGLGRVHVDGPTCYLRRWESFRRLFPSKVGRGNVDDFLGWARNGYGAASELWSHCQWTRFRKVSLGTMLCAVVG